MDSSKDIKYLFFVLQSQDIKPNSACLDKNYSFHVWKPAIHKLSVGKPLKLSSFLWSLFHYFRFFRNHDYSIFTACYKGEVIHFSVVLPTYFRLPFMASNDLNIGPCWTHHDHRRKGIAFYVIQKILELHEEDNRKFWFFTREYNVGSIRLAEKIGFILYGRGCRKKRFGIKALGAFVIEEKYS